MVYLHSGSVCTLRYLTDKLAKLVGIDLLSLWLLLYWLCISRRLLGLSQALA